MIADARASHFHATVCAKRKSGSNAVFYGLGGENRGKYRLNGKNCINRLLRNALAPCGSASAAAYNSEICVKKLDAGERSTNNCVFRNYYMFCVCCGSLPFDRDRVVQPG